MSLGDRLWKTQNLMFFFYSFSSEIIVSLWRNTKFPLGVMALPHEIHVHQHQGFSKVPQKSAFQVPELRITKKRNVVHARAPYQPATLFFMFIFHGGTTYGFPCFLHVSMFFFVAGFLLRWLLLVECCICCFHFPESVGTYRNGSSSGLCWSVVLLKKQRGHWSKWLSNV